MQHEVIVDLYSKNYSLRAICRELGISESQKLKISEILRSKNIQIRGI